MVHSFITALINHINTQQVQLIIYDDITGRQRIKVLKSQVLFQIVNICP